MEMQFQPELLLHQFRGRERVGSVMVQQGKATLLQILRDVLHNWSLCSVVIGTGPLSTIDLGVKIRRSAVGYMYVNVLATFFARRMSVTYTNKCITIHKMSEVFLDQNRHCR